MTYCLKACAMSPQGIGHFSGHLRVCAWQVSIGSGFCMSHGSARMRDFAKRLMACEAKGNKSTGSTTPVAFRALLLRATTLAQPQAPRLPRLRQQPS
jgi:hypothetical protein